MCLLVRRDQSVARAVIVDDEDNIEKGSTIAARSARCVTTIVPV